nr:hypothetical protein [Agrococcus sp. SGAir0287]
MTVRIHSRPFRPRVARFWPDASRTSSRSSTIATPAATDAATYSGANIITTITVNAPRNSSTVPDWPRPNTPAVEGFRQLP